MSEKIFEIFMTFELVTLFKAIQNTGNEFVLLIDYQRNATTVGANHLGEYSFKNK